MAKQSLKTEHLSLTCFDRFWNIFDMFWQVLIPFWHVLTLFWHFLTFFWPTDRHMDRWIDRPILYDMFWHFFDMFWHFFDSFWHFWHFFDRQTDRQTDRHTEPRCRSSGSELKKVLMCRFLSFLGQFGDVWEKCCKTASEYCYQRL